MDAEAAGLSRSAGRLLVDPVFGRFFWTKVLSLSGVWITNIAAAIAMWDLTGSAVYVGAVSAFQFGGTLLLSPFTGALTDVFDRRRLLIAGRIISGCAAGIIVIVPLSGGAVSAGLLLVVTALVGLGLALSTPALQALIPALVPRADLDQAIALNSVVGNVARAVGPAAGAGLVVLGGPAAAFGFAALSHLVFAGALVGLTPPTMRAGHGRRSVLAGLQYLKADRQMAILLIGIASLSFAVDPIVTLTPALADVFGSGEGSVGLMASVFGGSAVVSAMVVSRLRKGLGLRRMGIAGFLAIGAGLLFVAASRSLLPALVGFVAAGSGFLLATTALTTRIQQRVPEDLRGRVMALWTLAYLGLRPAAAGVNGLLADVSSPRVALVCSAMITSAAILAARAGRGEE